MGLSVNNLYSGACLHSMISKLLPVVFPLSRHRSQKYSTSLLNNFLQLSPTKCEVVSYGQCKNIDNPECKIVEEIVPTSGTAKCLGYLWNHDLSAKSSIEYNIMKARKSFLAYGSMDDFQGDLSVALRGPLGSHPYSHSSHPCLAAQWWKPSCILPILLYGAENWCLSQNSIQALDSFCWDLEQYLHSNFTSAIPTVIQHLPPSTRNQESHSIKRP